MARTGLSGNFLHNVRRGNVDGFEVVEYEHRLLKLIASRQPATPSRLKRSPNARSARFPNGMSRMFVNSSESDSVTRWGRTTDYADYTDLKSG